MALTHGKIQQLRDWLETVRASVSNWECDHALDKHYAWSLREQRVDARWDLIVSFFKSCLRLITR